MLAALGVALVVAASAGAASSRLGVVTVAVGPAGARSEALALGLGPDGKIVAGGDAGSTSFALALVRLRRNGDLDPDFGARGRVTTALGDLAAVTSVAVQNDGRILAAGTSTSRGGEPKPVLVRYLPDGSLDRGFGSAGVVTGAGGTLALQPDGRIVTTRSTELVRLKSDGSPDPTFGPSPLPFGTASAIALLPDGKIVAAGTECLNFCRFAVTRFTSTGAVEADFSNPSLDGLPTALALAPDGAIVLVGVSGGVLGTPHVWRIRPDGSVDPVFGDAAIAAGAVAVQPDGKIVLAGSAGQKLALARYRSNGSLDPSFGARGIATTDGGHAAAIAIQPDGRIVGAGATSATPPTLLVARYTSGGRLDRTFGPGCTVPRLIGLPLAKAKARVGAAGCRTGAVVRRSSSAPRGRVIAQTPKVGTRVELGARIRLVVSRG
jgi:uncharacterized delta-60 repeat protein